MSNFPTTIKVKLGSINAALQLFCAALVVETWDGDGERAPTMLELCWIGLPRTKRREAWERRWYVEE